MHPKVLIAPQGYNVHKPDWEYVIWGDPDKEELGRVPMALKEALSESNCAFLWNTGRSVGTISEAMIIYLFTLANLARLPRQFPSYFSTQDIAFLGRVITNNSVFEENSINTTTSMESAIPVIRSFGTPKKILLVSSANHISRVLRDAMLEWWMHNEPGLPKSIQIAAVPSHTTYGTHSIDDVSIWEKPRKTVGGSR